MLFTEAGIASPFRSSGRHVKLICILLVISCEVLSQSLNFKNYSVDDVIEHPAGHLWVLALLVVEIHSPVGLNRCNWKAFVLQER
jgi:hypothetical protein